MAIGYKCVDGGCGITRSTRWTGTCPNCGGFYNCRRTSMAEGIEQGPPPRGEVTALNDVARGSVERISSGLIGFDKILGDDPVVGNFGIAAKGGQAVQLCSPPGCGKSTLLLQWCHQITKQRHTILYVAGEESLPQIKTRADRIGKFNHKMQMLAENDLDAILHAIDEIQPEIVVIDSINTLAVEDFQPGSPTAIRTSAQEIYQVTNTSGIGLFAIVQMNKLGDDYAGPRALEHIMDTSLIMKLGQNKTRILESIKNRFGDAPMMQRFKMTNEGLVEIEEEPEPEPKKKKEKEETPTEPTPPHLVSVP